MKNVFILFAFVFSMTQLLGQTSIQIVSNTTSGWSTGTDQNGPFGGPVYDVGLCTSSCIIECECGSYPEPNLADHFPDCPTMDPIWGNPPPGDCVFAGDTEFWFHKDFSLDLHGCEQIHDALVTIQADQSFDLFINDTHVGASNPNGSQWATVFNFDVASLLQDGNNKITVRVDNRWGGSCFNYAFLAFCLDINIDTYDIGDGSFGDEVNNDENKIEVFGDEGNMYPGATHEWLVYWGELGETEQPNLLQYYPPSTNPDLTFYGVNADGCKMYRIIHRITAPGFKDCQSCFARLIPLCNDTNPRPGGIAGPAVVLPGSSVVPVDCSVFNGFGGRNLLNNPIGGIDNPSANTAFSSIHFYPNPAENIVTVEWNNFSPTNIRLLNIQGVELNNQSLLMNAISSKIDISKYPQGVYFLELYNSETKEKVVKRLVISK